LPLRREEGGGEDGVSLGAATTDLWVREGWWLVVKPVAHCASSKQDLFESFSDDFGKLHVAL